MLMSMCGNSFGVLLGCAFSDFETTAALAPVVFFPMMIFSGYYVNREALGSWISWLEYVSPFRFALESFIRNEFDETNYSPNPIDIFSFNIGLGSCIMIMVGIIVLCRTIAMIF